MSPDSHVVAAPDPDPAAAVVTFPMPAGTRFDWHVHDAHQLAWAPQGVLTVHTEGASFILPPTRALWIPVGVRHEVAAAGDATMRATYVRPGRCPIDWAGATVVAVGPLLAELVGYLGDDTLGRSARSHAEDLLGDLLMPVPTATIDVRPPHTQPARAVADGLLADPADEATLAQWGRRVGAGERTLARAFREETGLPFGRWRTRLRLRAALQRLAAGGQVTTVGHQVGYQTASAFVAAFRRETGVTPARYFASWSVEPATGGAWPAPDRQTRIGSPPPGTIDRAGPSGP